MRVKKDHTNETHHFSRHIKLAKGPKLMTKKNVMGIRTKFKVTELVISWRQGHEPTHVIAYGIGVGFPYPSARRSFKLDKAPQWIKGLV